MLTRKFPQFSQVYVHVTNHMPTDSCTLHWHGMTMRGAQWADGAAHVTQCPIPPGGKFTYR